MKHLMAIVFAFALSPITALVSSATMSKLWDWYVARDYGSGPSFAAWFGLNTILVLGVAPALMSIAREKKEDKNTPMLDVFGRAFAVWVLMGIMLLSAWCTGQLLSWI